MNAETGAKQVTNRCVVCKSDIGSGASLCPVCRQYQHPWRRRLQNLIGLPAVLALLIPVAANQGAAFVALFTDKSEIKIIQFASPGKVVILNNGDGTIVITDYVVRIPAMNNLESVTLLGIVIQEGAVWESLTAPEFQGTWNVINYRNAEERAQLDELVAGDILPDSCMRPRFQLPDAADIRTYKSRSGGEAYTLPATLTVGYFGVVSGESKSVSMDIVTTIAFNFACDEFPDELERQLKRGIVDQVEE